MMWGCYGAGGGMCGVGVGVRGQTDLGCGVSGVMGGMGDQKMLMWGCYGAWDGAGGGDVWGGRGSEVSEGCRAAVRYGVRGVSGVMGGG